MSEDVYAQLTWSDGVDNPFGIRCLDCRPFSQVVLSGALDRSIAARFAELRNSGGEQHLGISPGNPVTVSCCLSYPFGGRAEDGTLFAAYEMEDKWDIYLHRGCLYFARSWTGILVFAAPVTFSSRQAQVLSVVADAEAASDDPDFIVRQVDFLIKSHVLGLEVPHPLPAGFPEDIQQIASYSFARYGRRASFATFGDTLRIPIPQAGVQ